MNITDKQLIRISLIISILGLLLLYLFYSISEIPESSLSRVNEEFVDENIRVKGEVVNVDHIPNSNITIITLEQQVKKKVVVYDDITVPLNKEVIVTGTVSSYKGEEQITAKEIEVS